MKFAAKLAPILLPALLAASLPAFAQTQSEMTTDACMKLSEANTQLNNVFNQILRARANDVRFTTAFRAAQTAWFAYRDTHLTAIFLSATPLEDYGSVNPMCRCIILEKLTIERTKQLRDLWIQPLHEGDACAVSSAARAIPPPNITNTPSQK